MDPTTSARLDKLTGRWMVENGVFVVSRTPAGGLTAVAEGTSKTVPAGWVVMAGRKLAD